MLMIKLYLHNYLKAIQTTHDPENDFLKESLLLSNIIICHLCRFLHSYPRLHIISKKLKYISSSMNNFNPFIHNSTQ